MSKFNFLASIPGLKSIPEAYLGDYSTMKIGGKATYAVFPKTKEELIAIISGCHDNGMGYVARGYGSNTIFGNIDLFINMSTLRGILVPQGDVDTALASVAKGQPAYIEFEAGYPLSGQLGAARFAERHGFSGLEFAVGIPGTIAGFAKMNAGVGTTEASSVVKDITVITPEGKCKVLGREELNYAHRKSRLLADLRDVVIYSVKVQLEKEDVDIVRDSTDSYLDRRKDQPKKPSLGSFWVRRGYVREDHIGMTNPTQYPADDALQNARCGGMSSHDGKLYLPTDPRFISFIVAREKGATLYDLIHLAKRVYDKVLTCPESKIKLRREVRFEGKTASGIPLHEFVDGVFEDRYSLDRARTELGLYR